MIPNLKEKVPQVVVKVVLVVVVVVVEVVVMIIMKCLLEERRCFTISTEQSLLGRGAHYFGGILWKGLDPKIMIKICS
jgi:hypothetical protein